MSRYALNLRRITTHGNWIPEIDGLRFVAISSVLLAHILAHTYTASPYPYSEHVKLTANEFIGRGGRGVQLFFAISGFILAQPFLRHRLLGGTPVSISGFYKRRLTRLEPPYILSLLIYAVALLVHHASYRELLPGVLTQMFYVHNFTKLESVNFVTWSLEVEVQFYILAPLIGCLYAIRSAVVRRGVMVGITLASLYVHLLPYQKLSVNLPGQLQFFIVGFLLADLRAGRTDSAIKAWWDAVGVGAWVLMFLLPLKMSLLMLPGLILLACLSVFNGPVTRRVFSRSWIALTGGMCYSFYLMHMLVISTVSKASQYLFLPGSFAWSYLIQIAVLAPCVYVFCAAYYLAIERPCMDPSWPRKVMARFKEADALSSKAA